MTLEELSNDDLMETFEMSVRDFMLSGSPATMQQLNDVREEVLKRMGKGDK